MDFLKYLLLTANTFMAAIAHFLLSALTRSMPIFESKQQQKFAVLI
jgi:hypothetical protein